ncbi:MAG: hypothetical protein MAGBODY4_00522 [Candidatus Marinimicrobia bacterium]|nr:hypothetical protein [Candidatus Neomarinimicrobiota bacterium]
MSDIKRQLDQLRSDGSGSDSPGSSSIRDRLNRLYNRESSPDDTGQKYFVEESVVRAHERLEELIPGEYVNTHYGDIYRARATFPLDSLHGNSLLEEFFQVRPERLLKLGKVETPADVNLNEALFFDTEASGLSGGTGTYVFMIGLGYFHDDQFVVDQLFVDSYAKEEGMLDLLRECVQNASLLVSFNGKSFDVNLMNTRYAMHAQSSPFDDIPHLDLLHPSRNLWNLTLDNCKLQTLEREILEFSRENDTPGEEVPGIYFDFIRTGDPTEIAGVFEHNKLDIVSLVGVTTMLEQNFHEVRSIPQENGLTMFSRARIYERYDRTEKALECYQKALKEPVSNNRQLEILSRMASLEKRRENWHAAIHLWEEQMNVMPVFTLEPYEELAKYYEHQTKNYTKAAEIVKTALKLVPDHREDDAEALQYRMNRLERRMEREI